MAADYVGISVPTAGTIGITWKQSTPGAGDVYVGVNNSVGPQQPVFAWGTNFQSQLDLQFADSNPSDTVNWNIGSSYPWSRSASLMMGLFVNQDQHLFWATASDGANSMVSPAFNFVGPAPLTFLYVASDSRYSSGSDFDDIHVFNAQATPEPNPVLLCCGFLALALRRKPKH